MAYFEELPVGKLVIASNTRTGASTFNIANPNSVGTLETPTSGTLTAAHYQLGWFYKSVFTLNDVLQNVVNGTEYQSTKLFTFPAGRILVQGVIATLQQTTTSTIASTLNSGVTGAVALGSAAASNVSLTSTMVDFLPSTAFTSSTTINVAGTAVSAALAASTQLDGTTTAIPLYLNSSFATTTDVDADATQTWDGTITVLWSNIGDY